MVSPTDGERLVIFSFRDTLNQRMSISINTSARRANRAVGGLMRHRRTLPDTYYPAIKANLGRDDSLLCAHAVARTPIVKSCGNLMCGGCNVMIGSTFCLSSHQCSKNYMGWSSGAMLEQGLASPCGRALKCVLCGTLVSRKALHYCRSAFCTSMVVDLGAVNGVKPKHESWLKELREIHGLAFSAMPGSLAAAGTFAFVPLLVAPTDLQLEEKHTGIFSVKTMENLLQFGVYTGEDGVRDPERQDVDFYDLLLTHKIGKKTITIYK